MQVWQTTFLGMRELPRDISDFEMKAFFTFDGAEREAINARRGDAHKLGLALHIGFLRMSGRLLYALRVVPVALWRHLSLELGIATPDVASLRTLYGREKTLFDHQQVACTVLGFRWMSEHQRRSLVRALRDEVARCADRDQLLVRSRQWLYKNKLVIVHERAIRSLIASALTQLEAETGAAISAGVDPAILDRWRASAAELRPDGQTQQSWLWAAPAKHSTRQISEVLERIDLLYALDVHKHLADIPDLILRRYARRLVSRPPSAGAKIKEPARTVEVACFLRYCLFTTTDQLILMVQRRIADLWRQAAAEVPATVNWAAMYKTLLGEIEALSANVAVPDAELRSGLEALVIATQKRKPPSRASLVRDGYRTELIRTNQSSENTSSALIVVGRIDTGDLEAQIRGSRFAWSMRLLSIDSLIRLVQLKVSLEDPESMRRIHDILIPREFTKLDGIVDLVFSTAEDVKSADDEPVSSDSSRVGSTEKMRNTVVDLAVKADNSVKLTPVAFNDQCAARIGASLSIALVKRSRALYSSPDNSLRVVCLVSKAYAQGKADYWYGFHPHQRETLAEAKTGYVAFGCGSPELTVLIPFEKFLPLLDGMNTTNKDGRYYWHIQIYEEGGKLILLRKKGQTKVSLEEFRIR